MRFWPFSKSEGTGARPKAAAQPPGSYLSITSPEELEEALRKGSLSESGATVTPETAMRTATVFGCVRLLKGAPANLPLNIKRRIDARTREDATSHPLWPVLRSKPNRWQTPSQFKGMMQSHVCLRGQAFAHIVWSRGRVLEIIPLNPDPSRMRVRQRPDLLLEYEYGSREIFNQAEIFHLMGWTLDGINGVSPITYARETIGLSIAQASHGAATFKNGGRVAGVYSKEGELTQPAYDRLKASIEEFRQGGERFGGELILEEGLKYERMGLTAEDAQWIEARQFSRSDIAMFYGVPPFLLGDTEKSTSWGTGLEQQKIAYLTFAAEDHLTMWEEAVNRDLLLSDATHYARFNRAAFVKGDIKARYEAYTLGRRMKILSANDCRAMEDLNPIPGGDVYENPEITVPAQGGK